MIRNLLRVRQTNAGSLLLLQALILYRRTACYLLRRDMVGKQSNIEVREPIHIFKEIGQLLLYDLVGLLDIYKLLGIFLTGLKQFSCQTKCNSKQLDTHTTVLLRCPFPTTQNSHSFRLKNRQNPHEP